MRLPVRVSAGMALVLTAGCGPTSHIPPLPIRSTVPLPYASDSIAMIVRSLAPVLYRQRDEWFRLERVVAAHHPNERLIGYYLLWADDVHGAWIPFTKATDEEIVWVGYDSTLAPTDVWTYWHGTILHADWRGRGAVAVDVQWGKHGSMPRGIASQSPMWPQTLGSFWVSSWLGLPDIWLGRVTRPGPLCFCHGYRRYRTFDRPLSTADKIDVIVQTADPDAALGAVFGRPYSEKPPWPR